LGPSVNSEYNEADPFVAPDESYLIFQSKRPGGFGNNDLYISFRNKGGQWCRESVNLRHIVEVLRMKSKLFWIFWGIDALICIIIVIFFFQGLVNGSVSSFNIWIWIVILAALVAIMGGSLWLERREHHVFAILLLLVITVPGLFYVLIIVLTIVSGTPWI
jgi:hypothetical protein